MIHKLSWVARLFKRSSAQVATKRSEKNARFIFEEMEPRKLFSANPLAGLLEVDDFELPQVETLVVDHVSEPYNNNSNSTIPDDIPSTDIEIRHELVFVDSGVENYEQLIDDLNSQGNGSRIFSVFILDSGKNGIEQITEELQNYEDIDALHIISHGTPGAVLLGNTQLNSTNINDYTAQISLWQNAFDQDADILIYGCELVGNGAGENLTAQLSELTGADVAASVDDTGSAAQGGDWELEFSTGMIETEIAISEQVQKSWDGLLAYHTYRDEFNDISFSNSDGSKDWTGNLWQEIGDSGGASSGQVDIAFRLGEQGIGIKGNNNGVLREVNLSDASNATLSFDYARISFDSPSDFVKLEISNDGGGAWAELDRWEGPVHDSALNSISYDITAYIATNTQIKFTSSGLNNGSDKFFVDNFQIAYSSNLGTKSEFLVNQNTLGVQETSSENRGSHQSVAVASNGDYVVVWTEVENTGNLSDVFAQQYYADGSIKKAAFQVNIHSANEQQWASVASDASGQFVVTWTSEGQDGSGKGVYLRRFDASGTAIDASDIRVNGSSTQGNQSNTAVAVNSQGDMVITWQSDKSGSEGIFARKFQMTSDVGISGSALTTPVITAYQSTGIAMPSVDINTGGQFAITWEKDEFLTYFSIFEPNGAVSADKILTNTVILGNTVSSRYQDVVIQESGDIVIADWSAGLLGVGKGIYLTSYENDGTKINTTDVLSNSDHIKPSIAKDLNGNIIVVYEGGSDGDGGAVFGRKYDSSLTNIGEALQINETTIGDQQMASVAMLDLNHFVVAWSGNGVGDSNGVFVRQFGTGTPNNSPSADASSGSPYSIYEGESLTLDAANSSDPDSDTLTYSWDLDNNGAYGDATGQSPLLDWSTLKSYGINDDGTYTIGLKVDDGKGGIDTTVTTLTVHNAAPTLSTTGSSNVALGDVYTLNLSVVDPGEDTITEWTINWGDGTIETIVGNPSVVTHTYTNGGFTNNILASATDEDGTYLQNELLVVDFNRESIFRFAPTTGEFISEFGMANLPSEPGFKDPIDIKIGPDGFLYVSSEVSKDILRFNATTGAYHDTFISAGSIPELQRVEGFDFGPDGNLYVADWSANKVIQFDIADGSYMSDFVSAGKTGGNGGLTQPYGVVFGSDGYLYVNSYNGNQIIRYGAEDGIFDKVFVTEDTALLETPEEMVFGPDGKLYVASLTTGSVVRYDSLGVGEVFIAPNSGSLVEPAGIAFGPDGDVYISDFADGKIIRYNSDGTFSGTDYVVKGDSNLKAPVFIEFVPGQQVTVVNTNQTPVITDQSFSLPENSPDGNTVGTVVATDPDVGDNLSYTLTAGNDLNAFAMSNAGVITIADSSQLDFETNPTFFLTVQVMDDGTGTLSSTATISINLSQVNEAPVIAGQTFTLPENSLDGITVGTVTATDPDAGDNLSYTITAGNDLNAFAMSNAGVITIANSSQLDFETNPTFNLTVQVMDDGTGTLSSIATISINLSQVNEVPVIADQFFSLPENSLDGVTVGTVTATDPDVGDNLSYTITAGNDLNAFAMSNAGVITIANSSQLDFETNPTFNLTVQVMDDGTGTLSSTATTSINLSQVNEAPVIANQSFSLPENSLDGVTVGTVTATDPDIGDNLSYTITAGNGLNVFAMSSAGVITVANSSQLDFETNPTFNLTVQVMDDGTGTLSSTATTSINLSQVNEAPVIANQSFSLPENSLDGVTVGTVTATDPDIGDNLSYTITAGNGLNVFAIDSGTGGITVADSTQLNFEGTPTFSLTVQVTDDGAGTLSNTATITINFSDVNEQPVMTDQSFSISETTGNGSSVGTVAVIDPDVTDSLSFSITAGNDLNAFAINSTTGAITVADSSQLDFETNPIFNLTVQVRDDGIGNLNDTAIITINLTDVNEQPVINDQLFLLSENSLNGSIVGAVVASDSDTVDNLAFSIIAGNDANVFEINSVSGEITLVDDNQLDYETLARYSLTIKVTDNGLGNLSDTATINIDLIEINELPNSLLLSQNTIDENIDTSGGVTVGLLTAADKGSNGFQIIGGADRANFSLGGINQNELILKDGVLNFENQSSYQVIVSAIDSKGVRYEDTFTINVNNLNELPVITSSNSFTLEENISSIATVIAEDEDQPVQKLSFSLTGGADSELFLLDSDTGELSFKTAPDFENPDDSTAENVYIVEITVDDGNGGIYTQPVSIQIENAAEAPELSDQSVVIEEQSNVGSLVTTLVANDPDINETFSYSIVEGNLSDAFSIDNTGQLIVSNPELLINQDNSIVSVVIQVTDSQGLTDTSVVRIEIQNILPDTSTSKAESELENQDEFVFSVLTEIPLEDVTNLTKNETASIPELNETETIEQAKTEDNTVIENTENIGIDAGQGAVESGNMGIEAETIREKFSVSTQKYSGNKEDNSWTSKNILIKAKALMINNVLSPQFSYFDIEANALKTLMQEGGFSERLDELREQIQENTHFEKTIVGSSITLTTGLSIGYVIWLVRGGVLLSSVLSTLPAWRMIDPLPVISSLNGTLGDDDKNGDSLASLIKKGSAVVKAKVQASKPPND